MSQDFLNMELATFKVFIMTSLVAFLETYNPDLALATFILGIPLMLFRTVIAYRDWKRSNAQIEREKRDAAK